MQEKRTISKEVLTMFILLIWFILLIRYGNFFVNKILQVKNIGGFNQIESESIKDLIFNLVVNLYSIVVLSSPFIWKNYKDRTLLNKLKQCDWKVALTTLGKLSLFLFIMLLISKIVLPQSSVFASKNLIVMRVFLSSVSMSNRMINIILAPILEEFIYRGYLLGKLQTFSSFKFATLVVSLVFGLAHPNLVAKIYTFIFSILLCYMRKKSNSLWTTIILHSLNNTVSL